MTEHKTLMELYQAEGEKPNPPTPKEAFINTLADLTYSSYHAAKLWVTGHRQPTPEKQKVLAKHFGTTPEKLFPPKDKKTKK